MATNSIKLYVDIIHSTNFLLMDFLSSRLTGNSHPELAKLVADKSIASLQNDVTILTSLQARHRISMHAAYHREGMVLIE